MPRSPGANARVIAEGLGLTADTVAKILRTNAARLLRLGGAGDDAAAAAGDA